MKILMLTCGNKFVMTNNWTVNGTFDGRLVELSYMCLSVNNDFGVSIAYVNMSVQDFIIRMTQSESVVRLEVEGL
jgi:hypothetical protein